MSPRRESETRAGVSLINANDHIPAEIPNPTWMEGIVMKQVHRIPVQLALVFFLFFTKALAAPQQTALPKGVERVTSVEGIAEYRLANGLRVLLFPDLSKQTITVNITYLVGSLHESYGETGMAHLLEHLLFKGTPKHPDIPKELSEHGSRPNGTTWLDRTNYFETFQANEPNLDWALDLEADLSRLSVIKAGDFAKASSNASAK